MPMGDMNYVEVAKEDVVTPKALEVAEEVVDLVVAAVIVEAVAVLQDVEVEAAEVADSTDQSGWTNMDLPRVLIFALLWRIYPAA